MKGVEVFCYRVKRRLQRASVKMLTLVPKWRTVHYMIFNSSFWREQKAVIAGKRLFEVETTNPQKSSSFLRRSIHRIEKGLISRPRRPVFASDYILMAVKSYEVMLLTSSDAASVELAWAHDVLKDYFSVVKSDKRVDIAKQIFRSLPPVQCTEKPDRASNRTPYVKAEKYTTISYLDFLLLAKHRRSVRWFQQKPVPRDELLKALAVATQSPSACNRQPFTFRVFDKEPHLSIAAGLPPGTRGFEHNFPCVIAVVGHQRYYSEERDRHLIYIDGSLATMSLILALETLGLSSCCINWPDIEEREIAAEKALKLEADERIVMFIAVGYADPEGLVPYSEKRSPEELCRFNFE